MRSSSSTPKSNNTQQQQQQQQDEQQNQNNNRTSSTKKNESSNAFYNQFLSIIIVFIITTFFLHMRYNHLYEISSIADTNVDAGTGTTNIVDNDIDAYKFSVGTTGNVGKNNKINNIRERNKEDNNIDIDADVEENTNSNNDNKRPDYHLIFSTDCTEYQRWQSYLFFYNAYKIKQHATSITRIVSGCDDTINSDDESQKSIEEKWHTTHVQKVFNNNYHIHFTPKFSHEVVDGKNYEFFNKPFGILHYLEHFYSDRLDNDGIIFIFDPDMILLKPITHDFGNDGMVIDGKPYAQKYGYGSGWLNQIRKDIPSLWNDNTNTNNNNKDDHLNSILNNLDFDKAGKYYAVGPPYVGTYNDIYKITKLWCTFVPNVYNLYPKLLAEMFAYSAAAAHLGVPHVVKTHFMISDVGMNSLEAWPNYFDNNKKKYHETTLCDDVMNLTDDNDVPYVMHYCQRYMIGKHFFGKKRIPTPFFQCSMKYLSLPPANVTLLYDYMTPPPPHKPPGEKKYISEKDIKRNAIVVCLMTKKLNEALQFFKSKHCEGSEKSLDGDGNEIFFDLWNKK